jgi:Bacterial Ig-like domain (group 3)/Immunoglobulin domain/Putative Ig domain
VVVTRIASLIRLVPVVGLVALGLTAVASPADASTTLTVTTTADSNPASGPCATSTTTPPSPLSLRDAVCVANNLGGAVTISVPAGTYDLSFGELDAGVNAGQNVTIIGAGATSTVIDAQSQSRVLNFDENLVGGISATVQDVTISGGSDSTVGGAGIIGGSGNSTAADSLTIDDSVITGNHANNAATTVTNNPGGGIQFIGGRLTITDSTISSNSAQSSPGAAVFYQAEGQASPESFTMSGSTISDNTGANSTASTVPTDGAVDLAAATGSVSMSVSDSTFTGNALTGTSGPVRGAGLTLEGGAVSVTDSDFSGNSVTGATSASGGGAIAVVDGSATVTDDRIVGNTAGSAAVGGGLYDDAGTANATNDWWGCNAGPGSTGCDSVSGSATTNPRVELTASPVTVPFNGTAQVTANLDDNSAGATVGTAENDLDGVAETFTNPAPSGATCSPASVAFSGGTATASCTFNPEGLDGNGDVVVTVDNQSITVPVTITEPPSITTQPSDDTVAAGGTATFTAAASGFPAPTVQWQVSSNGGSTFTNINGATSTTLSFTATTAESGNLYRAVFTSSAGSATTDPAVLTEQQAPSVTSADAATFTVGTSGTFDVTTGGFPPAALSESGALPSGVTFTDNGNGTATLAGTPASGTGGTYPITITAANGVSPDATQSFTLTIDQAPSITSSDAATFDAGSAGSFTVTTGGLPHAALSESGALPSGVTFTDNGNGTATLAGTPASGTGGSYPITITAANGVSPDATQSFTLTVHQAPAITSANATTFSAGTAGSFTVTTTGSAPTTLSESGALPAGVTFTDNGNGTATLAGTPASGTGGSYPITITAANGVSPDATQSFTLTVHQAPSITSSNAATFDSGAAGTFTVTTGGFPHAALSESGALPSGVTFTDNGDGTASLAGTTTASGTYPITITADNGVSPAATQSFTLIVTTATQTITFTSTPPAAVVGETYIVSATGGPSGNPVTFSIDPTSAGVCTISGPTVTFTNPGSCLIDAAQAGNAQFLPATASQSVPVSQASTTTTVTVQRHTITATVAAVPPGAGTPTGTVTFSVNGKNVGTAPLSGGTATLAHNVPRGGTRNVAAVYGGDTDFTGSSGSTSTQNPSITAAVSSKYPKTKYGWYRSPVTVTFACTAPGAPLTKPCPGPVTLTHNGAGQSVTETITATNGGTASVTIKHINIDTVPPTVSVFGPKNGATYFGAAPAAHCVGHDALSGLASCTLSQSRSGDKVTVTATATDRAGNVATASVTFNVLGFYVLNAPYSNGAFQLREGHSYTFVVLTAGSTMPQLYAAVPDGQVPSQPGSWSRRAGHESGLNRYTVAVPIGRDYTGHAYWDFGVKVGSTMNLIRFHPVG